MTDLDTILPVVEAAITNGDSMYSLAPSIKAFCTNGANMTCLVFDDVAVKWTTTETPYHAASGDDEAFIHNIPAEDRKYFPDTMQLGRFIIQERIYPIGLMTHVPESVKTVEFFTQVVKLAYMYGLTDLHGQNIGIRSTDDPTPVILDVSGRLDLKNTLMQEMQYYGNNPVSAWEQVINRLNLDLWMLCDNGTYDFDKIRKIRQEIANRLVEIFAA